MFGFSLAKLLVFVVLVGAVWYGFQRLSAPRRGASPGDDEADAADRPAVDAEDMVNCPVCGHYVASQRATSCGRGDCPYPR